MNNNSGVNTIILVIILGIILAGATWFFTSQKVEDESTGSIDMELTLPTSDSNNNN